MRKSRALILAGSIAFHKMWRGHNREPVLRTDDEKRAYATAICNALARRPDIRAHVKWYSYCLMNNHPHEVGAALGDPVARTTQAHAVKLLGDWMRNGHSQFAMAYNQAHGREGAVTSGRAKTEPIFSDKHTLRAMFYGDANPVRAGLVRDPQRYPWSTCNFYCTGTATEFSGALTAPPVYLALGHNEKSRQRRYRRLLTHYLREQGLLKDLDAAGAADDPFQRMSITWAIDEAIAEANRTRSGPDTAT